MSKWCGAFTGGGLLLMVAGAGLWLASASMVSGQGPVTMSVAPASQNVALGGDLFIVDIKLNSVENLGAFDLTMSFDPDVLEYTGIAESEFIYSTGRSVTCVGKETSAATVNSRGAFNMTCSSNGLVEGNSGIPGPSASGSTTLASVAFKPKGVGVSDIRFRGWDPNSGDTPYKLADGSNGDGVYGYTGLGEVEVCNGNDCDEINIDVDVQNATVKVFDPNAATPTGVPATPTKEAAAPQRDIQATVQAALGTPTRRLTPVAGSESGGGSSGDTLGGSTRGGRGLPSGTTGGRAGQATGPNGAPVAGYGPQSSEAPSWPRSAGIALAAVGLVSVGAGSAIRRRRDA
jgi:hypothetical protein